MVHQLRSDRVHLDVAGASKEVVLVHDVRSESPLPQVSPPSFTEVDAAGVVEVCLANGRCQGLFVWGNDDQVDMVGHEAVAPEFNCIVCAPLADEVEVGLIVFVGEEGLLATVAALGDVVRVDWCNGSRYPCHNKCDDERDDCVMSRVGELRGHHTYL